MIGDGFPGRLVAALSRGIATPIALLLATTMAAAQASVDAIVVMRRRKIVPRSLQEYHAKGQGKIGRMR